MKWCDRCGGPLRPVIPYSLTEVDGCRLCGLEVMADFHERALNFSLRYVRNEEWDNSPATSMWLPDGAMEPFFDPMTPEQEQRTDEALLEAWLMYHQPMLVHFGGDFLDS